MRLSQNEINIIKKTVLKYINADIYIFGSRLKDNLKGGDVDIFISTKEKLSFKEEFKLKLLLKMELKDKLFLPVDVVFDRKKRAIDEIAKQGIKI